ncbi:hypothetical protein D3C74_159470 [compost metagenome]
MIKKVQGYVTNKGISISAYLESKYQQFESVWEEHDNLVTYTVKIPGLRSPAIYKWGIVGRSISAVNGKALSLTPELDKIILEQQNRKKDLPIEDLEIYDYIRGALSELEEMQDGFVSDQHYDEIINSAASKFRLSIDEMEARYIQIEKLIYDLN